jgi:hypothetical protein
MRHVWDLVRIRTEATVWRAAAGLTGFAVHHPRTMRGIPVGLLAMAAFLLGRAAGQLLAAL